MRWLRLETRADSRQKPRMYMRGSDRRTARGSEPNRRTRRTVVGVVVSMLSCWPRPAQAARILQHYDTDSLCSMAQVIVRAGVGQPTPWHTADGDCANFPVKVQATFRGTSDPGRRSA